MKIDSFGARAGAILRSRRRARASLIKGVVRRRINLSGLHKRCAMANRRARRALRFGREVPPPSRPLKHSKLEGVGPLVRQLRNEELDLEEGELATAATSVVVAPPPPPPPQAPAQPPARATAPPSMELDEPLPAPLTRLLTSFAPDFAALVAALHKTASRNAPAPAPLARRLTPMEAAFLQGLRAFLASRRLPTAFLDAHHALS